MSREAMQMAQPEQESVKFCTCPKCQTTAGCAGVCALQNTTPQPRQWVGLTDEEIDECERLATIRHQRHKYSARGQLITPADGLEWHFAGAIEAKLKEKNT